MPVEVAVIESNPLHRLGLVAALQEDARLEVIAAGADVASALRGPGLPAAVLIGSCGGAGPKGAEEIVRQVRDRFPDGPVVILAGPPVRDVQKALAAAQLGRGVTILDDSASPGVIARTVLRAVLAEGDWDYPMRVPNAGVERLTPREWDVVRLLGHRWESREIAEDLGIAYSTVRSHLRSIYAKFGVTNRRDAVREAVRVVREWNGRVPTSAAYARASRHAAGRKPGEGDGRRREKV